ncbi:hypothetical protein KJ953_02000 [Patescibacteria group bacterium]|nr:hypothetical protein [Patescibacteria group bacterium]MBU1256178.1 hypothetical protein [Patescibacteria group bacterium]MBU1457669.1 hypothetical protein [Patescibacteria group bacterium]
MSLPQTISIISTSLLTVTAVIIGIQLILILKELRHSLLKFNKVLDTAESSLQRLSQPATAIAGILEGFKQSSTLVQTITGFLNRNRSKTPPVDIPNYDTI